MRSNCDFCDEFSGNADNAFQRIYGAGPFNRILLRTEEFVVAPSLGQIVEGHLLVLPQAHLRAVADLSATALTRFAVLTNRVGDVVSGEYGRFILFEHGTRAEGMGGCGISHAHLHVVPIGAVEDPVATLKSKFPFQEFDLFNELGPRSRNLPAYLFYRDFGGRLYLFDTGPLPSQYMRRLLAGALHEENWDWRTAGREERLLATLERLSPRFAAMQQSIESHTNA
jgi:diadenosine tetraphosphate (Ap4A) HIT family hydrolase